MAADPSALSVLTAENSTHELHHPSLVDQMHENLRIAHTDARLAEFVPELEKKATNYEQGVIDADLTLSPNEQAHQAKLTEAMELRVMKNLLRRNAPLSPDPSDTKTLALIERAKTELASEGAAPSAAATWVSRNPSRDPLVSDGTGWGKGKTGSQQ
jgi:hypothetical protein